MSWFVDTGLHACTDKTISGLCPDKHIFNCKIMVYIHIACLDRETSFGLCLGRKFQVVSWSMNIGLQVWTNKTSFGLCLDRQFSVMV